MAQMAWVQQHPGNRLLSVRAVRLADDTLTLEADQAAEALVVLKSPMPLQVVSVTNASVELRPGWDGTLGYSHYGLAVTVARAGRVTVRLRGLEPPPAAELASPADTDAFREQLSGRASRFPDSPATFREWQARFRALLAAWLMGGKIPERVPLSARVTATGDWGRFVLRTITYQTLADRSCTALLALPKGVEKAPLLLALHGHEAPWGAAVPEAFRPGHADDFCASFAQRGWAVLQTATMNHALQHATWTLQGEWSWDAMRGLDYALELPEVDASRVAVCGLSTGGHLAMNVLALDDRVKAGVAGCIFGTWNHLRRHFRIPPHCDCGISFQLGSRLEQCDWAALAAPKPVQFQHGRKDTSFCPGADPALLDLQWNTGVMPENEYAAAFREVERAYSLAGAPGAIATHVHPGTHQVDSEAAFAWLTRWTRPGPSNREP